jgi:rod shape-determining protein MreD
MILIFSLLIGLLVVILQITLVNLIAFFNVKPDLIMIFLAARALLKGPTAGVMWGFGMGLLLDALSGGLMGLGSLVYSLSGFICGQIGANKISGRLHYLLALLLATLVAHALLLYFTEPWREIGLLAPLIQQYLPGVGYTMILGAVWMFSPFTPFHEEKKRA